LEEGGKGKNKWMFPWAVKSFWKKNNPVREKSAR